MKSFTAPPPADRSVKSLVVSILLLVVLVADPSLIVGHFTSIHNVTVLRVLSAARIWLVGLAICYTVTRLAEQVLQRKVRHARAYILLWSAVIPVAYALGVRQLASRFPLRGQRDVLLLAVMALVTAFGGYMLKRLADSVNHTVQFDHLTGLPNRMLLNVKLAAALAEAKENRSRVAIFLMNIDRFKRVNDSLGIAGGDAVLMHVARQLSAVVPQHATLARIGSDEFVVVLPERKQSEGEALAGAMLEAIARSVMVGEREVCVTASLGHSLFPDDGTDAPSLLHAADAAMYSAKHMGREGVQVYPISSRWQPHERMELEEDFRNALRNGELTMHYQPQVRLATGEVTGLEALLRWHSRKHGNIPPADFLAIAEEVGLMVPVGEWALKQCCQDCAELQKITGHPLTVALNLSARQFSQESLPGLVERALAETGLPARQLELEITEQMLMVNTPYMLAALEAIRKLGVGIAIDDFGTGFSSFSYILQYKVDRIKIDQSFVARSIEDPNAMAIVRTIIAMAHGLNMRVVAEGVETVQQSDFLMRRRCDEAQGYLFARPMPKSELPEAISRIAQEVRQRTTRGTEILPEYDDVPEPKSMLRN